MYEAMYASIPDVNAYLRRLEISEIPRCPDRSFLDILVHSHQCHILFENLDTIALHKPVSLDIPDIFEKIVIHGRGGYCFEQNALFTQLLNALGYQAYACMCRITRGKTFLPPIMHRGILVTIDGQLFFCDVGYGGPSAPGCLPVLDGSFSRFGREEYHITKADDYWWNLCRITSSGKQEQVMQFYTMPQKNVDFITMNEYCSRNPKSVFSQKLFLNLRLKDGSVGMFGNTFTENHNGHVVSKLIKSDRDFLEILTKKFQLAPDFCQTLDLSALLQE